MSAPTVRYEVAERIATLTLDRPAVKNALSPVEWQALAAHVAAAAADPEVRVLVVTGAGGDFSAGGDLKTMPERLALPREARRAQLKADGQVVAALAALEKPVLAMIDGVAVGAGLSLALACDVRIASSRARFGAGFHKIGLTGDFGLLWLLPRTVGPARALDLLYTGDLVDAVRAEAIGLVARVVEPAQLAEESYAYARRLAAGPPIALGYTKRGIARAFDHDLSDLIDWEADAQAACSKSADAREGVAAFSERRPPRFRGC